MAGSRGLWLAIVLLPTAAVALGAPSASSLSGLLSGSGGDVGYMSSDNPWSKDYQPTQAGGAQGSVYFRNCDAARAAGAAPIHHGAPGYRSAMDRDGDGVACEPHYGR